MAEWQNRIVDTGSEDPQQLLANPKNWRIHPKQQQDALANVLDRVGWVMDVIVNRETGFVVDGHLRVAMAISREEPAVPVSYVELSDSEEDLVLASLDPVGGLAITDPEALGAILELDTTNELAGLFDLEDELDDRDDGAGELTGPPTTHAGDVPMVTEADGTERPRGENEYVLVCPDCGLEFPVVVDEE